MPFKMGTLDLSKYGVDDFVECDKPRSGVGPSHSLSDEFSVCVFFLRNVSGIWFSRMIS